MRNHGIVPGGEAGAQRRRPRCSVSRPKHRVRIHVRPYEDEMGYETSYHATTNQLTNLLLETQAIGETPIVLPAETQVSAIDADR